MRLITRLLAPLLLPGLPLQRGASEALHRFEAEVALGGATPAQRHRRMRRRREGDAVAVDLVWRLALHLILGQGVLGDAARPARLAVLQRGRPGTREVPADDLVGQFRVAVDDILQRGRKGGRGRPATS